MRVGVATLESFRLWDTPDQEWKSESDLIATIRGEFTATPKMLLGQAFGRLMEKGPERYLDPDDHCHHVPVRFNNQWLDYKFTPEVADPCFAQFDRRGVFEAKIVKPYGALKVVCKADQIVGTMIVENKAKMSQFDFDRYAESYQWRFELDIFEAQALQYKVFLLDENAKGEIVLKGIETFNLYPYEALHSDCVALAEKFTRYVERRNLVGHLQEMERKWA